MPQAQQGQAAAAPGPMDVLWVAGDAAASSHFGRAVGSAIASISARHSQVQWAGNAAICALAAALAPGGSAGGPGAASSLAIGGLVASAAMLARRWRKGASSRAECERAIGELVSSGVGSGEFTDAIAALPGEAPLRAAAVGVAEVIDQIQGQPGAPRPRRPR